MANGWDKESLEAIVDAMDEGVMMLDKGLTVRGFNKAAAKITGYPPSEAVGMKCRDVCRGSLCTPDKCPLIAAFRTKQPGEDVEMALRRRDGSPRIVAFHFSFLRDEQGDIVGAVKIFRDVTPTRELEKVLKERRRFLNLIGKSKAMQQLYELIEDIADSDATVLIQGETGTGKELVAEAIHFHSKRGDGPLVKVNCAALPEELLECELFGYVRGAFTDAKTDKLGRFELAEGGTMFLDEIAEASPAIQAKLLRVLERREFERVGGIKTIRANVRLVAATNKDLKEAVRRGEFREDLFYRLNVIPVVVPPLRERTEDIPLLVEHFINKLRRTTGRQIEGVSEGVLRVLMEHPWQGNVRELENALEFAFVACKMKTIEVHHLPPTLRQIEAAPPPHLMAPPTGESEREKLLALLEASHWKMTRCAKVLGIGRTTLWRKMKEYGIEKPV